MLLYSAAPFSNAQVINCLHIYIFEAYGFKVDEGEIC